MIVGRAMESGLRRLIGSGALAGVAKKAEDAVAECAWRSVGAARTQIYLAAQVESADEPLTQSTRRVSSWTCARA